ncbi:hypothetical protein AB0C59_01650 [Streptomyces sp. NPDC048664]|uniref:hypothetical protein n=1 Tax=Streptomyces sp. NPDC048664 TaxID=3154505 RepID=UPI00344AEAC6
MRSLSHAARPGPWVTCPAAPAVPVAWHTCGETRAYADDVTGVAAVVAAASKAWVSGVVGAVLAAGSAVPAVALPGGAGLGLAYHGYVDMGRGEVNVRLTPWNSGAAPVVGATVRLRWSVPLADEQRLPDGCERHDATSVVLCRAGAVAGHGRGAEIHVRVRLADPTADEVSMEIDSLAAGDAADRDPGADRQQVVVLETGVRYTF